MAKKENTKEYSMMVCCDEAYVQPAIYAGFTLLAWTIVHNIMNNQPWEAVSAVIVFGVMFALMFFVQKKKN